MTKDSDNGAFSMLHPAMQRWVWRQGWHDLRPVQRNAIPEVLAADRDVIIAAPTAGGKTEAAYLPVISRLLADVGAGPRPAGFGVLAISPLKALINDQSRRLEEMCAGTGIDVTPWHGDVAASTKRSALASPGGILLITPESLEGLLSRRPHQAESALAGLRYVVIDEFHALSGNERGIQVQSLLARIERMLGRRVPRIAVSATFADYGAAGALLRPGRGDYPLAVPGRGAAGQDTMVLLKEYVPTAETDYDTEVVDDIYRNLRGSSNLVFANSRKEAETLALKLRDKCAAEGVPNEFHVHHGSLSRQEREGLEQSLKQGARPSTAICTSTLELGIDIGRVSSVAQVGTADSVIGLRQRLGRSGRRGEPSVLRLYSHDEQRDDYKYHLRTSLVQNIAVLELLSQGRYEVPSTANPHYSTLVQQLLSLTAQYGGFHPREAWQLLCRDGAFRNVGADDFLTLLRHLGSQGVLAQASGGQIVIGREGERIVDARDFCSAFVTLKDLEVVEKTSGRRLGVVQYKPYAGEYILLGARRWLVENVDDRTGRVYVNAAHTTGKLMFEGFGAEVDGIVTRRMRQVYTEDTVYPYLDRSTDAPGHLAQARAWFRETGLDKGAAVEVGGTPLLFTWAGARVNRTIALMAGMTRQAAPAYDPYAVSGLTAADAAALAAAGPVDGETLAATLPRRRKIKGKYDYLLPDGLLDRQYAASMLDTAGARESLSQFSTL